MSGSKPIGFAGLGHMGLVSAAAATAKGFPAVGFDADGSLCARLAAGEVHVRERGLPEIVADNRARLSFGGDVAALRACDPVFLTREVAPSSGVDDGGLEGVNETLAAIMPALGSGATLVVTAQVPPGFTRALADRRRPDEPTYYQAETLIVGRAVERALSPERFIVGAQEPEAPLSRSYATFLEAFECPVLGMSYESAELAKMAINLFLATSVGAADTVAEICERIGADYEHILPALRSDRRIGEHAYAVPSLGLSGGNIERDLRALRRIAAQSGSGAGLLEALLADSARRRDWALRLLHAKVLSGASKPAIAILGVAYKAGTDSTRDSPALALIPDLVGATVRVFDPAVDASALTHLDVRIAVDALEACEGADAVCVMTPWIEFARIPPTELAHGMSGRCVIDPYGVFDPRSCEAAGLVHYVLGRPYPSSSQGGSCSNT